MDQEPPRNNGARRGRRVARWLPLLGLFGLGLALWWGLGLGDFVTPHALEARRTQLLDLVEAYGLLAGLLFVAVYALATAVSLPLGALLTLLGGFLFGPWAGTAYAVTGATLGAIAIFLAARTALGTAWRARVGGTLERMRAGFRRDAFSYLLVLRLIPLFPFWLVNLVPAFLGVPLRIYVAATAIGIIPGTFVYASVGNGLGAVVEAGEATELGLLLRPAVLLPLLGLALIALLPVAYRLWKKRRVGDET
ncbi:TVP38/TMEM64 family protein [Aquibaculum arenosum]|uniref:TVP38/TMEM64 family membrane protein n=1 Tax=Aquibaculum arenosum TaxID=3032591 RepID=A0ABT5YRI1_9PROT|nr:VTT domain-containing protein [Fodinicurvata sp. CAU 1616]MDF2097492.1 VTT domain-containing protein [Fodinicurvata sp. CAU 1616]